MHLTTLHAALLLLVLLLLLPGVGAYQDSRGNPHVRKEVAKFIEDRDGVGPADPNVSC
jgi:aspartate/methionine/tyrosine aminotransferase